MTVLQMRASLGANLPSCVHTAFRQAHAIKKFAHFLQCKPGTASLTLLIICQTHLEKSHTLMTELSTSN